MSLSPQNLQLIEAKADDVLQTAYGPEEIDLPIDINKVAEIAGLTLKIGEFEDKQISGYYDKAKKTIYVSRSDPYYRQVFTVAHELGHFYLHNHKEKEIFYRKDPVNLEQMVKGEEQEANWFAASLLIPRKLLEERLQRYSSDAEKLSQLFKVSYLAMYWRMKNLGFI